MVHQRLAKFFSFDIGIDLGTANSLVYIKDMGVVLAEPSVVALNKVTGEVLAVGMDAKQMLGRTPGNLEAIRPMRDGIVADPDITERMLKVFIAKAKKYVSPRRRLIAPRVLIAIPSGITPSARRQVEDSVTHAGAREVHLIEEPKASAIGVGLPVMEPIGSMIVDIGGGTTEVAVLSLADIVDSKSIPVGGDKMDKAIEDQMKRIYNLSIGPRTAENIKVQIGSAYQLDDEDTTMNVKGRDLVSGLPKTISISAREVRTWLQGPVTSIVEAIRNTLERCPPELAGDLIENGIMLAGGGAMLRGLDKLISEEVNLPCFVAEDPQNAVANGTGMVLQNLDAEPRAALA